MAPKGPSNDLQPALNYSVVGRMRHVIAPLGRHAARCHCSIVNAYCNAPSPPNFVNAQCKCKQSILTDQTIPFPFPFSFSFLTLTHHDFSFMTSILVLMENIIPSSSTIHHEPTRVRPSSGPNPPRHESHTLLRFRKSYQQSV